ncbi:MAG: FeoB-associated Cys-rich membrane protein [Erysipelotrichaceae bacterium]
MIDLLIVGIILWIGIALLRYRKKKGGCAGCSLDCSTCHTSLYDLYKQDQNLPSS